MRATTRHYASVYETRLIEKKALTISAPPVKIEVITGPAYTYRLSNYQAVVPLKGEFGEEVEIPGPPPIDFEDGKRYIIVSTRTTDPPATAEDECRRHIDRIIAIVGLLQRQRYSPSPSTRGGSANPRIPRSVQI